MSLGQQCSSVSLRRTLWLGWKRHHLIWCEEPDLLHAFSIQISQCCGMFLWNLENYLWIFVHFSFSMSLEYGRKQVSQIASESCGLTLPCDFRCGPLIMMFRTNITQDVWGQILLGNTEQRHALLTVSLSFLRRITAIRHTSI